MKLDAVAGRIRRFFEMFRFQNETGIFLKSRNARVTVQDATQRSFHVFRLTSCTDIAVFGRSVQLQTKYLSNQTVRLTIFDKAAQQVIFTVTAPVNEQSGTAHLNFDDIRLKIDIDAAPANSGE